MLHASFVIYAALAVSSPPAGRAPAADKAARLEIAVRDVHTGFGIGAARVEEADSSLTHELGWRGRITLAPGLHELTVSAPGYRRVRIRERVDAGAVTRTTVWLAPLELPRALSADSLLARSRPGRALVTGHVTDAGSGLPVAAARVALQARGLVATTDRQGYFELSVDGARSFASPDTSADVPDVDDVLVDAPGFKTTRIERLALVDTALHLRLELQPGAGETRQDAAHKQLRVLWGELPAERDAVTLEDADAPEAPAAPGSSGTFIDPIDSINVSGVGWLALESYVEYGLDDEWIASWSDNSLRAGAVAYRTYGSYKQITLGYICATAACQVYNGSTWYAATSNAAKYTSGILLQKGGSVAMSEFSAENNSLVCGGWNCASVDTSCGNNYAGSPSAGWPCLSDAHSYIGYMGSCCYGHGRGMCQWGTEAWSQAGQSWKWMVDKYYNANGAGSGNRTMYMTTPLVTAAASASPSTVAPGGSFTVNATGRNYAEGAHSRILMLSRLTGPSTINNGSGVKLVTLSGRPSGGTYQDTALSQPFTVPAGSTGGIYSLVVELWFDVNGNSAVDTSVDLQMDTKTYASAVTVSGGGGGCIASVASTSWKGEYFPNKTLTGSPTLVRDEGTGNLNFAWGSSGPNTCSIGTDNFSARYTRTINFSAGTWRFSVSNDDGMRLYVDGALKLDKWFDPQVASYTVDVVLTAGNHTVVLEYYEALGGANLSLSWAIVNQTASFTCDDGDSCFALFGPSQYWHRETLCSSTSVGYSGDLYWTYVNGSVASNYVRWTPSITGAGNFEVYAWIPRCFATSQQPSYRIRHNGADNYATVNQNNFYDAWVSLGIHYFAAAGGEYVELTDATGESATSYRQLAFDAVNFVRR